MQYQRMAAALAACLMLCGCQQSGTPEHSSTAGDNQNTEITQENSEVTPMVSGALTTTARSEKIEYPENLGGFSGMKTYADGFVCFGGNADGGISMYQFGADFRSHTETPLVTPAAHDGDYYQGGLFAFGENAIYGIAKMENHSNMEPYREEMGEDFDWDAWHSAWETEYLLCTYAMDGTLTSAVPVEGLEDFQDQFGEVRLTDLYWDGQGLWLCIYSGVILRFSLDGTYEETYRYPLTEELMQFRILPDRDGIPVLCAVEITTAPEGYVVYRTSLSEFRPETGEVAAPFYTTDSGSTSYMNGIYPGGCGEYRMFVAKSDGLYGILDDSTEEMVIDWNASNLSNMPVIPLADGTFIGAEYKPESTRVLHLTRKYESEIEEKKEITLGVLGSYGISDFVRDYNASHEDHQIDIVVYENSDGTSFGEKDSANDALDKFKLDIISGNAPDIVLMYDGHEDMRQMAKRGAFLDLNRFMETDPAVNRDTVLPNILSAVEAEDGGVYFLPPEFEVATIAVKQRLMDKENWTVQDMIDLYADATADQYKWTSKSETLEMLLYGTDFIDEEKGSCHFDSPEFLQILEFCNRYPDEIVLPEKDYEDPAVMEIHDQFYADMSNRYRFDEDYLYHFTMGGRSRAVVCDYSYARYSYLGEEFTFAGYPSENGKGGKLNLYAEFAISGSCDEPELAWKILSSFMQAEFDTTNRGYPVIESEFEAVLDEQMYVLNYFGITDEPFVGEGDSKVYPLNAEERERVEAYLRTCDTVLSQNPAVQAIVMEEAEMYFSGDQTAEAVAERIQSRAEILVSEQS